MFVIAIAAAAAAAVVCTVPRERQPQPCLQQQPHKRAAEFISSMPGRYILNENE